MSVIYFYQGTSPEIKPLQPSSPPTPTLSIQESDQISTNSSSFTRKSFTEIRYYQQDIKQNNNTTAISYNNFTKDKYEDEIRGRFDKEEYKLSLPPGPRISSYRNLRNRYDSDSFPIVRKSNNERFNGYGNDGGSRGSVFRSSPIAIHHNEIHPLMLDPDTPPQQNTDILIGLNPIMDETQFFDQLTPEADLSLESTTSTFLSHIANEIEDIPVKKYAIGANVSVKIGEILSPGHFYIVSEQLVEQFIYFQKSLNNFYENISKPNFVLNTKSWYAAKIPNSPTGDYGRVKILQGDIYSIGFHCMFIDYGVTAYLEDSQIFLLDDQFKLFPQLAVKAKLYGVSPPNGLWTKEITCYFRSMVEENDQLFASITENDEDDEDVQGGDETQADSSFVSIFLSSESTSLNFNIEISERLAKDDLL